jgi:hypothetical protein
MALFCIRIAPALATTYSRLGYKPDEGMPWDLFVVLGTRGQRQAFLDELQRRIAGGGQQGLRDGPAHRVAEEVLQAMGFVARSGEPFRAEGREGWWQLEAEAERVEERLRAGAPGPFVLLVDDAEEVVWARGEVEKLRELARQGVRIILAAGADVATLVEAFDVKPHVFRIPER